MDDQVDHLVLGRGEAVPARRWPLARAPAAAADAQLAQAGLDPGGVAGGIEALVGVEGVAQQGWPVASDLVAGYGVSRNGG